MATPHYSEGYVRAAVEGEIGRIRSAPDGSLWQAVFAAACAVGRFVGAGALREGAIHDLLVEEALGRGMKAHKALDHVRRGIARGAQDPPARPGMTAPRTTPVVQVPRKRQRIHMPAGVATEFWMRSKPVHGPGRGHDWILSRHLDPHAVSLWDLAREIPEGPLPSWAHTKQGSWGDTGHLVILPMYSARGELRGFRARSVNPAERDRKTLCTTGFTSAGLVFACPLARQILATGCQPKWWQPEHGPRQLQITEGGPDFLTAASRVREDTLHQPATLGVISGSWTSEHAARIPPGSEILLATHHDAQGESYCRTIARSLGKRHQLLRIAPQEAQ